MSVVFLDTETTGLDPRSEELFEVAVVTEAGDWRVWHLEPRPDTVREMHPKAAAVNRYHERTAQPGWEWDDRRTAAAEMFDWLDGKHIVGAVPDFDTRFLTAFYDSLGWKPPRWHYHLIDVETLAVGYLRGLGRDVPMPWDSDDLSRRIGVEPPGEEHRHTALGDAIWAARIYRAIVGDVR